MNHLKRSYESKVIARRCLTISCSFWKKKQDGLESNWARLVACFSDNTSSNGEGVNRGLRHHLTDVASGADRARLSATQGCHAGVPAGRPHPCIDHVRNEPDAGAPGHGRPPLPPLRSMPPAAGEWREPRHCATSERPATSTGRPQHHATVPGCRELAASGRRRCRGYRVPNCESFALRESGEQEESSHPFN